jgi:hypothetical protein
LAEITKTAAIKKKESNDFFGMKYAVFAVFDNVQT